MRVKICGITQPAQGAAIARMGATALGFICVHQSPRYVSPEQIRAVVAQLPIAISGRPAIDRIGVFVDAALSEICQTVVIANLSGVQLHGQESPEFCAQLCQLLPNIEILKAIRVRNIAALQATEIYANCIDTLLLDAYHPNILGGTGKTLDWKALQQFRSALPWLLAGGLNPDNVLDALRQLHPDGIDLSSGVEHAPGDKNLDKVARLFERLAEGRG